MTDPIAQLRPSPVPRGTPDGRSPRAQRRRRRLATVLLASAVVLLAAATIGLTHRSSPPPAATASPSAVRAPDALTQEIQGLQEHLRVHPDDYAGWGTLGIDYVQQAKDTVNPAYYPKAEGVLNRSLQLNTDDNFIAMAGMADLRAAEHNFPEALTWAQRASQIDPYNSTIY